MDPGYYIFCSEVQINYFPSVDIIVNNDPFVCSVISSLYRDNDQF